MTFVVSLEGFTCALVPVCDLCDPDVVVAMAGEDMQGFKRYVKQGREGVGMLFPGIRIRVDQDEESEVERRESKAPAMRWSKGSKQMCENFLEK